jgi:hypothetical protein
LVSLVVFLTPVSTCILFLPFFLLPFDVNGQTNIIFVLLCNWLCSYVLLVYQTQCLFWFSMYNLVINPTTCIVSNVTTTG